MNIIVIGCGKVGVDLAKQLAVEKHDVTVIDTNADKVDRTVSQFDVQGICGNGTSYRLQLEAGAAACDLLVAVTGTDEVNAGTGAIRDVGLQFSEILSMVNGIKTQMDEINSAVKTVAKEASTIVQMVDNIDTLSKKTSTNMRAISDSTEEQSASNEEIAAASHALSDMAGDMQDAVGQFKF